MTTAALIEALDAAGLDVHGEAVLDALWLSSLGRTLSLGDPPAPRLPKVVDHYNKPNEPDLVAIDPLPPISEDPQKDGFADKKMPDAVDAADLFDQGEIGPEDRTLPAASVLLPSARALSERLPLLRALRPFRQLVPSACAVELDEERTAELTAEIHAGDADAIFAVLRPRYERRYEAHVVVEDEPAMALWEAPAREFAQLLRDAGAFRLVRSWRLRLDDELPGNLAKAQLETPAGGLFSPGMLGHAGQLMFFLSPGRSLRWVDGTFARLFESWSSASVALLHLRSRDRWADTLLGEPQGLAHTLQPGSANRALEVEPFWWRSAPDPSEPRVVKLPAIPLEAEALGQWARMQMGLGRQAETFLLDAADTLEPEEEAQLAPEAIDIGRALAELRETSDQAYDLAILLSNAPFTLPVARLVQEVAHGGSTDFSVLADLMLSGIVVARNSQMVKSREQTYFEVRDTARLLLLRSLRGADADNLVSSLEGRISRHLQEIDGRAESFSALMAHPDGIRRLPDWARPFAHFLSALKHRRVGAAPSRTWQSDMEDLRDSTIGRLARLAAADVALSRQVVDPALWPAVDNPRFIMQSTGGELRFVPAVAGYLRERLAAAQFLGLDILWVDDNPDNNASFIPLLAEGGATTVELALSTEEGLADPEITKYDIILSDMSRNGDDRAGYTLLQGLRERGILTPVLFFAGYTMSSPDRRAEAIAAGAFGATNNTNELFYLVDRAARSIVFRPQKPAEPIIALRALGNIPRGEFCTLEEIYREVERSDKIRNAAIVGSLLFFRPEGQRSWLVATSEQLAFILDDPKTREEGALLRRVSDLTAALPVSASVDANGVATAGFGRSEPRWYYSSALFETPAAMEAAVLELLEKARPGIKGAPSGRQDLSSERGKAQAALRNIGIECVDEVALDIIIEAAKLDPPKSIAEAISLSRLFRGAFTVGDRMEEDSASQALASFASALKTPRWTPVRDQLLSEFRARGVGPAMARLYKAEFSANTRKALQRATKGEASGGLLRSDSIVDALLMPDTEYRSSRLYKTIADVSQLKSDVEQLSASNPSSSPLGEHPGNVFGASPTNFSRAVRKGLGYHATYSFAVPIVLGTVGVLEDDVFRPIGHINEIIPEFRADTEISRATDLSFELNGKTRTGPDSSRVSVTFSRRNGILLYLSGCRSSSFVDMSAFTRLLIERFQDGSWKKNWHVVTQAIEADSTTILISGTANSSAGFQLDGGRPRRQPTLSGDVTVSRSKGLAISVVATPGLTPLFRLVRIRRRFLGEPQLEMVA